MPESPKSVELTSWPDHFHNWAVKEPRAPLGGSPAREELKIEGAIRCNDIDSRFLIGVARDAYGSVLHLSPAQVIAGFKKLDTRKWNQWWAKVATRAGYLVPVVDPVGFARLSSLRRNHDRVEFIVDTNILVSGVGHWLVRWLGDRADLVRTVVTDLELQRWADGGISMPKDYDAWSRRAQYLASCRFLECLNDRHPIWRRIDTEEETALFTAKATAGSSKDAGADTLLLRSARRLIQDEVPGLIRLFVTADQNLARSAVHELPANSTIAAYVNPIPETGAFLSPLQWWPSEDVEQGEGHLSTIADFLYECTCLCDRVFVTRSDGAAMAMSAYVPGKNQFPSDWRRPLVWYDTVSTDVAAEETSVRPAVRTEAMPSSASVKISLENEGALVDRDIKWPFRATRILDANLCAARVPLDKLFDTLHTIMIASRDKRKLPQSTFSGSESTIRELKTFLRCAEILGAGEALGPAAGQLVEIFATNDLDGLSELFTAASHYAHLIRALSTNASVSATSAKIPERSFSSLASVAKMLGQAVQRDRDLAYGGAYVSMSSFRDWLLNVLSAPTESPFGEMPIATLASKALYELRVSPARFGMALDAALKLPELKNVETSSGGTPENVLSEIVVTLSPEGYSLQSLSADGILGYRSLKWSGL